ncbi:MAG TPA: 50S ribosomal protein L15 [Candidatus Dormibacteraeota bacterium]|nr:50S ribosomal protein L15 [Candidatus Dormibacteraeota bacterium]
MKVHQLQVTSKNNKKRIGRGIAAGQGKTAGRGTKGQNSRAGGGVRLGFEGGQNPLAKRLPKKRGFTPINKINYTCISLERLNGLSAGAVTNETLAEAGIIKNRFRPVKILGTGSLEKKLAIKLQAATKSAQEAIASAGGSFEAVPIPRRHVAKEKAQK